MALLSSVLPMALGLWHVDVRMFINILIVFEQILWVYLKKTIGACFCILGICSLGFVRAAKPIKQRKQATDCRIFIDLCGTRQACSSF